GMGAPLNDVALAACGNAALFAGMRWRDHPSARAAVLTGLFAGLALGVKYPALVWAGLLGAMMLLGPRDHPRGRGAWERGCCHAALFGAAAILIGGCWYLRAYLYTGNPVHPFFRHTFGGAGIDDVLDPIKRPLAVTPGNLLTALGPMTLQPDRFDSVSHQFGPAFLLFLPALMLWRTPRRILGLVALGYSFLMICATQRQSMRFLLIAVGPMAVGVAWLVAAWRRNPTIPRRLLLGLVVLVLGFEAAIAAGRARHGLSVVLGRESAEAFLERCEPTYRVGRWIAKHLPPSARLVGQEHRGFYLPRPYTMELAHRRRTGLGTRGESADEVVEHLRRSGFTHLLLCPPVPESAIEFDSTLDRLLAPWLAARRPLYREAITDPDGVTRLYAIYDLSGSTAVADARTRIGYPAMKD
ncbi:MAG: 4-amino-4-deoxy-L-arabinose transferase, partial [Isosphaeraceae bacterium]|nr:4-amino-4-deoxy-L-arabinose transferase [Isosphaeraceae bacterium]